MFRGRVSPGAISEFVVALAVLGLILSPSLARAAPIRSGQVQTSTWSIVAADPATGDVGVAAASCVPNVHADAIAALVPGKGAAATQALWALPNRNKVYELLQEGIPADGIIRQVSDPEYDPEVGVRQYGIVTIRNGTVTAEAYTGERNPEWAGDQQDAGMGVTVQGNILVSAAVVEDALKAFRSDDAQGRNTLPDRLMRALEAGSAAGGDSRCNDDQLSQTAATAVILVARGEDSPYAAKDIDTTDMGTADAPWLAISVAESRFGPNPLVELRSLYDLWRVDHITESATPDGAPLAGPYLIAAVILLALVLTAVVIIWVKRARSG